MSWHPEPIGTEVGRALGRLGPEAVIGPIVERWADAVGAPIAANAWPARIARDGTLHVATSSSAWAFELTALEAEIRARLTRSLGPDAPPRIRFAVGRLPEPGRAPSEEREKPVTKVRPEERAEAERLASSIADSELRSLVARAAAASLARSRREPDDRSLW